MATLLEVGANTTSLSPTTTWAAPNGLFGTEIRNDGSVYSFDDATATVTIPNEADGYLIVAAFEYHDTSNGRHNPQARIIQSSGTGTFVGSATSGYNRDNSEDRSYCRCWAFVDGNSNNAEFTFQWRRDSDGPTGGTERSHLQVIPLFYSDVGIYSSSLTTCTGGTTPTQITSFGGTDGTNITMASDTITIAGDNKRYLCFGGYYWQGIGNARTQRWGGFRVDGTFVDYAKGYSYARNGTNADIGEMFTTLLETETVNRTIDMAVYRGDGVASGEGGADVDGNTTGTNPNHAMVILELNDGCEVFHATGSTNQNIATTGPVDIQVTKTTDIQIEDTDSFVRSSDTEMGIAATNDYLFGSNLSAASQNVGTGQRYTGYAEFTVNGTEDDLSVAGDYCRNNQGSQDTFGWSANLMSYITMVSGSTFGVSATELVGSEGGGGAQHIQVGWSNLWGVNLDTMEGSTPEPEPSVRRIFSIM